MSEQYPDLGITQKQDGDYWDVVIPDLDCSTDYALQAAWVYSDKSFGTSEFSDRFNFRTPGPRRTCPINVVAVWDNTTSDLKVSWEKPFLEDNVTRDDRIKLFQLTLSAAGEEPIFVPFAAKVGVSQYSYTLSQANNMANFGGVFQTTITGKITSIYGDGSSNDCAFAIPVYVDPICVATSLTPIAKSTVDGIIVSWQDPATSYGTYRETKVYLSETNSPYSWELVYTGFGPALISKDTLNTVYIKVNHLSDSGCESIDSPVIQAKILDLVNFKDYPPDEFVNITSTWIQNSNSLNDLSITFNLPAVNPEKRDNIGKQARVYFTVLKNGINTEEFIDRSFAEPYTPGAQKTIKIFANELYGRFGSYNPVFVSAYSNKKGKISSIDQYENVSSGVAFDLTSRQNPLETHTPTILVSAVANGYKVSNTNTASKIDRYEVYSSKSASGPFSLVYSGILPAFILDTVYTNTYVKVKAITLAGDLSLESQVFGPVKPLSVAETSLIEFPVSIGTEGSIWSGPLQDTEAPLGEPDKDENGRPIPIQSGARAFFNRRGFFIYDSNDELTTQIIGNGTLYNNPYAGTGVASNPNKLTFITKSAQIANWRVSTDRIENTLSNLIGDTYTGMSGAGNFAFWAGAKSSGNLSSNAKFQVTHAGKVTATDIDILGGKLRVGADTDATAPFLVTSSGLVTASGATINGTINAVSGKIGSVDVGGTMKVLDSNSDSSTFGKYVDKVVSGQIRVSTGTDTKIEMGTLSFPAGSSDFNAEVNAILSANAGIQITNALNKYVQLDSLNGILANKGFIGGWKIEKDSISKAGTVGLYAPSTPVAADIAFWAGASRTGTPGPNFSVTHGGSLIAKEATLFGSIEARAGYFGLYDPTSKKITSGWKITGPSIQSFMNSDESPNATPKIKLDGLQGSIIGGNIVGSNHYFMDPNIWNTTYTGEGSGNPGGVDYISSTGAFRLAGGKITYSTPTTQNPNGTFNVQTDLVASNIFLGTGESFSNDYLLGKNTTIPATGSGGVTKSSGSFSLGGGALTYNATTKYFEINGTGASYANFKIRLNVTSNEDNTFGDSTIVQDSSGNLTTGRAFYYGGATLPTAGTGATARSTAQDPTGRPFVKGDIWLSRTA